MTWQILPISDGLGEWRDAWDDLNQRLYRGHPFSDSRFIDALLRHFGVGNQRLCVHRSGEKVDGMIILYPRRPGIWTQFVPSQVQAAPVLIENVEHLNSLFQALSPSAGILEFLCQDPDFAPTAFVAGEAGVVRTENHALTMNVELTGSFDIYWKSRSKNLIKNIRRYRQRAAETFVHTDIRVLNVPDAMHEAVARYGTLESAGWKGSEGTAIHIDNTQGRFYAEIMTRFAETGQAQVVEYWLDNQLAASRLVISCTDIAIILKTTYDEALSKFAPGRLLLYAYLEYAFAEKRNKAVEFYTNATQDQLAWATGQRYIRHVMYFRATPLAQLRDIYENLKTGIAHIADWHGNNPEVKTADTPNIQCYDKISALPTECEQLFRRSEQDSFDLSSDWFQLIASSALPKDTRPLFYVMERAGEIRIILPLLLQSVAKGHQVQALTTFYSSIYRPLMADNVTSEELAVLLRRVVKDTTASKLRVDAMDTSHPSYLILEKALRLSGLLTFRFFCFGNHYLLTEGRSFAEYFRERPSQLRNIVRRREKKFLADGRGRLEIVTTGNRLDDFIQTWEKVYSSSWKLSEPYPDFIPGLIRLCAERGWLRLGLAYYDDKPIAAQIWIVNHGRAAIYKLAHDAKFSVLSAGTLLTVHLMRHVMDVDKVAEVDYLIGDDAYKKDWMSHRRERWGIVACNPSTLMGLIGIAWQIAGIARKRIFGTLHLLKQRFANSQA
jgi:CelD/BcsL family acetyltransferase involved in cellulose biosynthesis